MTTAKLQYKGTDQLYIPVDQMDLVQKYVASDDGQPKMHKLGGVEWKRTKAKGSTKRQRYCKKVDPISRACHV